MATMRKCGLDDFFAHGNTVDDAKRLIIDELPSTADDWDEPLALDDYTGPSFPMDALPGDLGEMVAAVSEETQTPPDMAATVALSTVSAAAGGKYQALIAEQGWEEPVHIMTVVIAPPASRKSSVIRKLTAPIVAHERELQQEERAALDRWDSKRRVLEKQLTASEAAASGVTRDAASASTADVQRMAAVDELHAHQRARPRLTRFIMDDATPEAVKSMLAEQGGAIAIMSAESAFLSNTAGGRYAANGSPNLDVILNGHAGDAITVDRKGRPSESIERACVTTCLMVQPSVIHDLGRAPGFITRGAAARFLPSVPIDVVGRRRIDVTPVPPETSRAWNTTVRRIAARMPELRNGCYTPWSLTLSPGASDVFRSFREWHERQMTPEGAFSDIRDWAGKQAGAILRTAGLLHIFANDEPESKPITVETLQAAIRIVDYFASHARIMYRLMQGRAEMGNARIVLDAIKALGSPTTRREVHRKLHNRTAFAKSSDLEAPLQLLQEYMQIRWHRDSAGGAAGRPSEVIELNPRAMDDKTDKIPAHLVPADHSVGFVIDFELERDEHGSCAMVTPAIDAKEEDNIEWRMTI